jgi:sugar/nucleoside kinase (ribokinase family)
MPNAYLYGMTVLSTVHRLRGEYPEADGYAEIAETHVVPGGEAGNSAHVLARWGHRVKIAGPFLGAETRAGIVDFFGARGIDCSPFEYDATFPGVRDVVLVAGKTRSVFGWFGAYFSGPKRWSQPRREDIAAADVVGLDPFFGDESLAVARMARELGKPYVTIDCAPDSELHRHAAVTVVSGEYLRNQHPGAERRDLLRRYASAGRGLVVFTSGDQPILCARGGDEIAEIPPFRIDPVCTLGAGDTFRGGVMHGIVSGWSDTKVVRFAAATAACVCRRFPMAYDPPPLAEIEALMTT